MARSKLQRWMTQMSQPETREEAIQLPVDSGASTNESVIAAARHWRRLEHRRHDLAIWLIDEATNSAGLLIEDPVDAALIGDDFVPCSFSFDFQGRRYRISLAQTLYTITEV